MINLKVKTVVLGLVMAICWSTNTSIHTLWDDNRNIEHQLRIHSDGTASLEELMHGSNFEKVDTLIISGVLTEQDYSFMRQSLAGLRHLDIVDVEGDIPSDALTGMEIESLHLPLGVTLGERAFANMQYLKTLWMGDNYKQEGLVDLRQASAQLGWGLFAGSGVQEVALPLGAVITDGMFMECKWLETLWVDGQQAITGVVNLNGISQEQIIGRGAFRGSGIRTVYMQSESVLSDQLFERCKSLKTLWHDMYELGVVDLQGLTLGDESFRGSGIEVVHLEKQQILPRGIFADCLVLDTLWVGKQPRFEKVVSLVEVQLRDNYQFYNSGVKVVHLGAGLEMTYGMFQDCVNLGELVLSGDNPKITVDSLQGTTNLVLYVWDEQLLSDTLAEMIHRVEIIQEPLVSLSHQDGIMTGEVTVNPKYYSFAWYVMKDHQWQKLEHNALVLNIQHRRDFQYKLVVYSLSGETSRTITLGPKIESAEAYPLDRNQIQLHVSAIGSSPLTYQWIDLDSSLVISEDASFIYDNLKSNQSYRFYVIVRDNSGNTEQSEVLQVYLEDTVNELPNTGIASGMGIVLTLVGVFIIKKKRPLI